MHRLPATIACIGLAIATIASSDASAEPSLVNAVVAVVDGRPITLIQLRKRAAPSIVQIQRSNLAKWGQPDAIRTALSQTLEQMINDALIEQSANRASLQIGEKEVDSAIEQTASWNKISKDQLLATAFCLGMSERDLRDQYRRKLLEWRLLNTEYLKGHDEALPTGDAAALALEAWKKTWLASRRRAACVETLLPAAGH